MERVSSRQNPVVKHFRAVANGDVEALMLLDGEHLIREALGASIQLEIAAVLEGFPGRELTTQVERTARQAIVVSAPVLSAISPVRTPSGIVAIARRPDIQLDDVFSGRPQLVLLL